MSRSQIFRGATFNDGRCDECGLPTRIINRVKNGRGRPPRKLCTPCYDAWRTTQPPLEWKPGKPSRRIEMKENR